MELAAMKRAHHWNQRLFGGILLVTSGEARQGQKRARASRKRFLFILRKLPVVVVRWFTNIVHGRAAGCRNGDSIGDGDSGGGSGDGGGDGGGDGVDVGGGGGRRK